MDLSSWELHSSLFPATPEGQQTEHRTEVSQQLSDFWKQACSDNEVDNNQAAHVLDQDFLTSGPNPLEHDWQELSLKDLRASVRNAGAAAVPDNWSSEEINRLYRFPPFTYHPQLEFLALYPSAA